MYVVIVHLAKCLISSRSDGAMAPQGGRTMGERGLNTVEHRMGNEGLASTGPQRYGGHALLRVGFSLDGGAVSALQRVHHKRTQFIHETPSHVVELPL